MANQARTKNKSRKPPRPELEPISYEEIMANAGMSGFVSFLDAARPAAEAPVESYTVQPSGADPSGAAPLVRASATDASVADAKASNPASEPSEQPDTVQDSITVHQSKLEAYTVQVTTTVQKSDTVKRADTVQDSDTVQQSKTVQETYTVQANTRRRPKRRTVARALSMEDGHSLAEQQLYRTLWEAGAPDEPGGPQAGQGAGQTVAPADLPASPDAPRLVRLGYDRLATLVRMSWLTVKTNLRSLEHKLAIEVAAPEDSARRAGKQYRVFSAPVVVARREEAGLVWVRRTRGVELLTQAPPENQ